MKNIPITDPVAKHSFFVYTHTEPPTLRSTFADEARAIGYADALDKASKQRCIVVSLISNRVTYDTRKGRV